MRFLRLRAAVPQLPMTRKIRLNDAYGSANPLVMVNGHRAKEMGCHQSDRVPVAGPTLEELSSVRELAMTRQLTGCRTHSSGSSAPPDFQVKNGDIESLKSYCTAHLYLLWAADINSHGEITGWGVDTSTGEIHTFLALPNRIHGGSIPDVPFDSPAFALCRSRVTLESSWNEVTRGKERVEAQLR